MNISIKERFKSIAHSQRPGDLWLTDMIWPDTVVQWVKQGAPKEMINVGSEFFGNQCLKDYFKHDSLVWISKIKSGTLSEEVEMAPGLYALDGSPLVPGFGVRMIAEDERTRTFINPAGQTMKVLKEKGFSMPMFVDWPVKDRATWNEVKKRLDPNTPERWPDDWDGYVKEMNSQDDPLVLQVGSFYGFLRDWVGSERILYMFYDAPDLIEDMMEQILYLELEVIKRAIKDIKVDVAAFWEDMAYKAGPFISPEMVRKYMMPRYKKITDLLHSHGVDIIYVDCDGNVEQLIPLWLEVGINYIWPLEQTAGNDPIELRKKYGKELIMGGGIDKRVLIKGKDAIREEILSKVPYLLEQGGYFPSIDHVIPPTVPFENYCYYVNTLREVAGLEKLSF